MPSSFASELADFHAAIDECYAQDWTWTPYKEAADVNAPPVLDTSRSGGPVRGTWFDKPASPIFRNPFDVHTAQRPGTAGNIPRIELLPDAEGKPIPARKDDVLLSEKGNRWRIAFVIPLKSGINACYVNAF